jgi:ligand-binding SRPBCC domain-containing protein
MHLYHECLVKASFERVRQFFENPKNLLSITPLSFMLSIESEEPLKEGLRIRLKLLGITLMESLIRELHPHGFTDIALKKPFFIKGWKHVHRYVPKGSSTVIEDELFVESHIPAVLLKPLLRLMFIYRCGRLRKILD